MIQIGFWDPPMSCAEKDGRRTPFHGSAVLRSCCFFFSLSWVRENHIDVSLCTSSLISATCCDLWINFTNSTTLVGRCRDRPSSPLLLTCPNLKNVQKRNSKNQKISKNEEDETLKMKNFFLIEKSKTSKDPNQKK